MTEDQKNERVQKLSSKKAMLFQAIQTVAYEKKRNGLISKVKEIEKEILELQFGKEGLKEIEEAANTPVLETVE